MYRFGNLQVVVERLGRSLLRLLPGRRSRNVSELSHDLWVTLLRDSLPDRLNNNGDGDPKVRNPDPFHTYATLLTAFPSLLLIVMRKFRDPLPQYVSVRSINLFCCQLQNRHGRTFP